MSLFVFIYLKDRNDIFYLSLSLSMYRFIYSFIHSLLKSVRA